MKSRRGENTLWDDDFLPTDEISPVVKWIGGKTQLLSRIESLLPDSYNRYYEPFLGGGALLFSHQPNDAVVNDRNEQLMNVYEVIKNEPDNFIHMIQVWDSVPCDKDIYLSRRDRFNEKISGRVFDVEAALFVWLNKHCFNGLYRVNAKGLFNAAFNNKLQIDSIDESNVRRMHRFLKDSSISLRTGDFETACQDVQEGDFVYFDSPYAPISSTANFVSYDKSGFNEDNHRRLAELFKNLDERGAFLLLSNHNVPLIRNLYEDFDISVVSVRRSVNRDGLNRTGEEVLIKNF